MVVTVFYRDAAMPGGAADDFMVGSPTGGANHTLDGGAGDDLIIGDYDFFGLVTATGASALTASDATAITNNWSAAENTDIADATTVPNGSWIIKGMAMSNGFPLR